MDCGDIVRDGKLAARFFDFAKLLLVFVDVILKCRDDTFEMRWACDDTRNQRPVGLTTT